MYVSPELEIKPPLLLNPPLRIQNLARELIKSHVPEVRIQGFPEIEENLVRRSKKRKVRNMVEKPLNNQ